MPKRVQFAAEIEPLVQFIEDTDPSEIVQLTLAKLRAGVSTQSMLTASALAATRSSDLPPGHHGGPLHPLAGLHAMYHLVERLEGEQRFVPVLQHVALANNIFITLAWDPIVSWSSSRWMKGASRRPRSAFLAAVNRGEYNKADHYFLWLGEHVPPIEAFDLLMTIAIPKNVLDDHYFIFPAFTWRALESIGHEYLPILMRPAVRYVTVPHRARRPGD